MVALRGGITVGRGTRRLCSWSYLSQLTKFASSFNNFVVFLRASFFGEVGGGDGAKNDGEFVLFLVTEIMMVTVYNCILCVKAVIV